MKRIGILAGTFDPVHKGHLSFAMQAAEKAGLDAVYLIPEPKPRYKGDTTHISHRTAMLHLAVEGYSKIKVLELPDKQFLVATTLPRLKQQFPNTELVMLVGIDVLAHMSVWPHIRTLLKDMGLVVAVRGDKDERHAFQLLARLPVEPREAHVLISNYKMVAAREIRSALKTKSEPEGMLGSVKKYIKDNWLYQGIIK